ncbi:MAG: ABC transporter permease [Oscillospiraceae bacterium]|nr:ABC transporter permease [Oscillospiraceae bacterium]
MNPLESFELAIKNIAAGKVRAFLTMLGIIIGVMAVILIVGIGNGLSAYMVEQFQSMGTNTLNVNIFGRGSARAVSPDDMYALVDDNPDYLALISPTSSMSGDVKTGNETYSTSITGVGEDYFDIRQYSVNSGRGLYFVDIDKRSRVCVVGSYIANEYYSGGAVGERMRIAGTDFTIVGVLAEEADSEESGTDDAVYVPYSVASRLSGAAVNSYVLTVVSEDEAAASKKIVENKLLDVFGNSNAYRVQSMTELLDTMSQMLGIVIIVLAAIAGISLVVGGVGIMNIMLVSVTERTREIGIRKALGAKERYIMSQFVIEAAVTSAIGGLLGIAAGYGLSTLATRILTDVTGESLAVSPTSTAVLTAFGVSAAIGILFGYLPAKKAARLNPIDALRYE